MRERVPTGRRGGALAEGADAGPPASPGSATVDACVGALPPAVDLRVVLFTVTSARLRIALQEDVADRWRLPRGGPQPGEPLDAEARRIVREATGLREQYLEQLYTLSLEDQAEWTVSVAYLALIWSDRDAAPAFGGDWFDVDGLPPLSVADRMVVDYAVVRLRAKIGYTTIAFHLMPPTFTLGELQATYEAILGRRLDKRNFRRRVIAAAFLEPTGDKRRDGSHRPAVLYRFRAAHDRDTYLTPPWSEDA